MLLGTFMLTATVAQAGNVLYAEAEGETMILKCADSAPEGLKVYDGTTNWQIMGVTTVIVDASCQSYTGNTLDYLFNTASNKLKTITGLNNLNTASVTSMGAMFLGCSGLTSIDISSFNTANVTVMSYMFFGCSALTSLDLRSFNTSHVTDMTSMFAECSNLTSIDLSGWNTTNVISMYGMFNDCSSLTSLDLSGWNTTNVMRMSNMFWYCKSLTTLDLSGWNTANVTEMYGMFNQCEALTTIYADNWDTSKVPSNNSVFSDCPKLVGGAGTAWQLWRNGKSYARIDRGEEAPGFFTAKGQSAPDPVKVKEAYAVLSEDNTTLTFYYDDQKERREGIDISPNIINWFDSRYTIKCVIFDSSFANCTSITSTARWFDQCKALTTIEGIQNLKTENVTDMSQMFWGCSSLTALDVSGFNTTNVTDMSDMFTYCMSLATLDLSGFSTEKVTDISSILEGCSTLTSLSLGFDINQTSENSNAFSGIGSEEKSCILIVPNDLRACYETALTKGNGQLLGGFFSMEDDETHKEPYAVLSEDNITLTFYYDENKEAKGGMDVGPFTYDFSCGVNSGWYEKSGKIKTVIFDDSFADCTSISSTAYWFYDCKNLTNIYGLEKLNTANVSNMREMFSGCSSLTSLDVSNFNTTNVTNMSNMFSGCYGLTSLDVSKFNTANVTNMGGMFSGCPRLTIIDVSNFNTDNVTTMVGMFSGCYGLTSLDVSKFNTANVTSMGYMFSDCSRLTIIDVSNFNTANVTSMDWMFNDCRKLTILDVSKFNTAKVTSMNSMFYKCLCLTDLDVSKFNTANVTDMRSMFEGCSGLTSLDVSKFNTAKVTNMYAMFFCCSGLTSLDVSNFNTANVTNMGYMFSRCSSVTSLDVSKFNTTKVTDMAGMFYHCSGLTTIYSNDGWNCESSNNMFKECTFLKGAIIYDSSKTDITYANPTTGYFTAFTLGDADGDGEITDKDVKAVEDNIMGYTPDNFIPSAADSNGDGVVNVADIVDINNKKK